MQTETATKTTEGEATYCPEDNKLRLYVGRVPRDEYEALRAQGWTSTPKQSCNFVATWTPEREDTALGYAGIVGDEDQSPTDRAADRAERFGGYLDKRREEAHGHADNYDNAPQTYGGQSRPRLERMASRHDRNATRALDSWSKAEYWQRRTEGVIRHALYVTGPAVRMGRIKELEAAQRKSEKEHEEYVLRFKAWKKTKETADPAEARKRANAIAGAGHCWTDYPHPRPDKCQEYHKRGEHSLYSLLTDTSDPITGHEAAALWLENRKDPEDPTGRDNRWRNHYALRLAYENQMLSAQGGRAAFVEMEPGGFIGNRQIQKVNKSPATGRVVSVQVWGERRGFTKESGYRVESTRPCLVTVNIERAGESIYRPPTDEERAAFMAGKKEAKEERGVVPIINPIKADAERLQKQMNDKAAKTDKGKNYPRKAGEVEEMTQAHFSAMYKDYRALQEYRGVKIRVCVHGWQNIESVVILIDKPQKQFPASVWNVPEQVKPATEASELIPTESMPFNLIQDTQPDGARIQADHDARAEREQATKSAQLEMVLA